MSENNNTNKQQKVYVPGTSIKEFTFPSGDTVIRFSICLEKFAPFVKQYKKSNGYINFNINKRKEVGTYGETHTCSLDLWEPSKDKSSKPAPQPKTPVAKKEVKAPAPEPTEEDFV